jgi:predicted methyltransferase MtxX (methanogen marker protein 4)
MPSSNTSSRHAYDDTPIFSLTFKCVGMIFTFSLLHLKNTLSRGYDVIVARDGVATATIHHEVGLIISNEACGSVISTEDIVSYMHNDFVLGEKGAVKGDKHPDGRNDD